MDLVHWWKVDIATGMDNGNTKVRAYICKDSLDNSSCHGERDDYSDVEQGVMNSYNRQASRDKSSPLKIEHKFETPVFPLVAVFSTDLDGKWYTIAYDLAHPHRYVWLKGKDEKLSVKSEYLRKYGMGKIFIEASYYHNFIKTGCCTPIFTEISSAKSKPATRTVHVIIRPYMTGDAYYAGENGWWYAEWLCTDEANKKLYSYAPTAAEVRSDWKEKYRSYENKYDFQFTADSTAVRPGVVILKCTVDDIAPSAANPLSLTARYRVWDKNYPDRSHTAETAADAVEEWKERYANSYTESDFHVDKVPHTGKFRDVSLIRSTNHRRSSTWRWKVKVEGFDEPSTYTDRDDPNAAIQSFIRRAGFGEYVNVIGIRTVDEFPTLDPNVNHERQRSTSDTHLFSKANVKGERVSQTHTPDEYFFWENSDREAANRYRQMYGENMIRTGLAYDRDGTQIPSSDRLSIHFHYTVVRDLFPNAAFIDKYGCPTFEQSTSEETEEGSVESFLRDIAEFGSI